MLLCLLVPSILLVSFARPSEQCMSTGGQNAAVTTAPVTVSPTVAPTVAPVTTVAPVITTTPTPCVAPANSAGIIIDVNPATQINSMGTVLGTCPCSNGLMQSYFADGGNNQANAIAALDVQCTDIVRLFH
uniref:Uncharacterized protein n=1 Tax=Ditylenchus dipsaci TaxID=166011 RepID=A0A915DFA6_9BILA